MIAKRFAYFRTLAGVTAAAMGLYVVTSQVGATRNRLNDTERAVAAATRDIARLETELATRANFHQLHRWNGESLALVTPEAKQWVASGGALNHAEDEETEEAPVAPVSTPGPVMMAMAQPIAPLPGEAAQ